MKQGAARGAAHFLIVDGDRGLCRMRDENLISYDLDFSIGEVFARRYGCRDYFRDFSSLSRRWS